MTNTDPADLLTVLLRSDLSSFIQRSFATVDPGSSYSHNWHIDAIAYQLERIARGEIRRLIITMPPRSLKSISASVAFPAWILGRYPDLQRKIRSMAVQMNAKRVLVEQAGSGLSLIQDLQRFSDLNVIGIVPKQDKATRLMSVSAMIEAGRVLVPKDVPWLAEFRRELTLFPNARHDDQVDSLSQFLKWFDQPGFQWYIAGSGS